MAISVEYEKPFFVLKFPYNANDLKVVRALPVREWNKKDKRWEVPELAFKTIDDVGTWSIGARQRKEKLEKAIDVLVTNKLNGRVPPNSILRHYQAAGSKFIEIGKKILLADDMGTGKSLTTINALLNLGTEKNLILCPSTLKLNWRNEFRKHFNIEPTIVSGSKKEREKLWNSGDRFIIANYDLLQRDWEIMPKSWGAIVCDESVYLKSHKSKRTKLVKKLQSNIRVALSGMPIENDLMEFHSVMEWLRPDILPTYHRFRNRYYKTDFGGRVIGYKNLDEIHQITSPFILRRTKEQVLDELPPKIYNDIPLELSGDAREAYDAICEEYLTWLYEQTGNNWQAGALERLIRMRQFVECPEILGFKCDNAKLDWLDELYYQKDKLVVFSFFKTVINYLQTHFNTDFLLTGDVDNQDRFDVINNFNEADNGILVCTDAGRFGLNITGADTIVHYGLFFNPATMIQREDRLHRMGQKNSVNVMTPLISRTIDIGIQEKFLKRLSEAKAFMDGSKEMDIQRLTKKDFAEMVR